MKERLLFYFLIVICFAGCVSKKPVVIVQPPSPPPKPVEKPAEPPKAELPKTINIALLLPFDFKTNLSNDSAMLEEITATCQQQLQFYEGAKLAVDSLKKNGFAVNIKVFDTAVDSISFVNLMYSNDVIKSDYIICSFNSPWQTTASVIAQKHFNKIIFTQPASAPFVLNNKESWQLMPSTNTQIEMMADYIQKNFSSHVISIVYRETKKEAELKNIFKNAIDSLARQQGRQIVLKSFLYNNALFDSGSVTLDSSRLNLILITSSDEAFVNSVINQINNLNYPALRIVGLPTWDNFESIDFSSLKNISVSYFVTNYIDYSKPAVASFQKKFIAFYGTTPGYSAFQGYNIIAYLSHISNEKETNVSEIFPFNFVRYNENSGFENREINVVGIENYKMILR